MEVEDKKNKTPKNSPGKGRAIMGYLTEAGTLLKDEIHFTVCRSSYLRKKELIFHIDFRKPLHRFFS